MPVLYFAYGSNLWPARMRERVPGAEAQGPARLAGFRLCLDKRGGDGSGKANLREDASQSVWGVLYRVEASDWPRLDSYERGYQRVAVEVLWRGAPCAAETYLSHRLTRDPVPFASYKRLIVQGARAQGLPEAWIESLEALPERPDTT